jgi:hypothetical protein
VNKLRVHFYWYQMKKKTVRIWIQKCSVCGARKRSRDKPKARLGTYIAGAPMDKIQIDIVGPFPVTENKNRYILVIQDQFSKWVIEAYALADQVYS